MHEAPPDEAQLRMRRELARARGDDEAVAHYSRLLWRYYVRARYEARFRLLLRTA